jgi:hypothetical protein
MKIPISIQFIKELSITLTDTERQALDTLLAIQGGDSTDAMHFYIRKALRDDLMRLVPDGPERRKLLEGLENS